MDMVWIVGVGITLFLVFLSITSRRWWPLSYIFAVLFGMSAGILLREWSASVRNLWWFAWALYVVVLPIWKTVSRRHRALYGE